MTYYLIYKTTNLINGKFYIGKHETTNINDGYIGSGLALTRAIKKYGKENFKCEILEYCSNSSELNEREIQYIDPILGNNNSYNIARGGQGGCIVLYEGNPKYKEVCKKISDAHLKNSDKISEQAKEQHKNKNIGMYGKTHSEETRQKMAKNHHNICGENNPNYGKTHSEETRQKIREANIGRKRSQEQRFNMIMNRPNTSGENNPMFGKFHSEETKQLQREKALARPKVICEHCNREITKSNYARWHGDNCKVNV